jgi:hypothetical protein
MSSRFFCAHDDCGVPHDAPSASYSHIAPSLARRTIACLFAMRTAHRHSLHARVDRALITTQLSRARQNVLAQFQAISTITASVRLIECVATQSSTT